MIVFIGNDVHAYNTFIDLIKSIHILYMFIVAMCLRLIIYNGFTFFFRKHLMASNRVQAILLAVYGNYLITSYLFVKLIYLANVVGQLFYMNVFLGMDYHMYGFRYGLFSDFFFLFQCYNIIMKHPFPLYIHIADFPLDL